MTDFDTPKKIYFENIVGKGENAGNQHFLLFPQCFLPFQRLINALSNISLSSAVAFTLEKAKILWSGKELIVS